MTRKILLNLLWKEWREHQWRVIICCWMMGMLTAQTFHRSSYDSEGMVTLLQVFAATILPIFFCITLGTERASGTLNTLLARPVRPGGVFAIKTLMGCASCVLPVLAITGIAWAMKDDTRAGFRELPETTARCGILAVIAYLWMLSLSVRGRNETQVGIACLCILVIWVVAYIIAEVAGEYDFRWRNQLLLLNPLSLVTKPTLDREWGENWRLGFQILQLPIVLWLWVSAARRFAEPMSSQSPVVEPAKQKKAQSYSIPRVASSPFLALLWKERKQMYPLGLAALACCAFVNALSAIIEPNAFSEFVFGITMMLMPVVVVLFAVTSLGPEIEDKFRDFVRSRPVHARQWFLAKQLVAMLFILAIPLLAVSGALAVELLSLSRDWNWMSVDRLIEPVVVGVFVVISWLLIYSITTLITSLVRHVIYAGMLSIGTALALYVVPSTYDFFNWFEHFADELGRKLAPWPHSDIAELGVYGVAALVLLFLGLFITWLAWRVIKWDWRTE